MWEEAAKFPLYGKLYDYSIYKFTCFNNRAEEEHLTDDSRRIKDIKPVGAFLRVSIYGNDTAETILNQQIGHVIGKRKCFSIFDWCNLG